MDGSADRRPGARASAADDRDAQLALKGLDRIAVEAPPNGARTRVRATRTRCCGTSASRVPPRAARGGAGGARGPGQPRGDAHRRRQEPLLPAARHRLGGPDGDRLAADRADGRPVPQADARWSPRRDDRLRDGRERRHGVAPCHPRAARRASSSALPSASPPRRSCPRSRPATWTCSWSTKLTACRNGVTTSAPTTCACEA